MMKENFCICLVVMIALGSMGIANAAESSFVVAPPSVWGEALYPDPQGPLTEQRITVEFASEEDSRRYLLTAQDADRNTEILSQQVMDRAYEGQLSIFTDTYCQKYAYDQLKEKAGKKVIVFSAYPQDLIGMPTIWGNMIYNPDGSPDREMVIVEGASLSKFLSSEKNLRKTASRIRECAEENGFHRILNAQSEKMIYNILKANRRSSRFTFAAEVGSSS